MDELASLIGPPQGDLGLFADAKALVFYGKAWKCGCRLTAPDEDTVRTDWYPCDGRHLIMAVDRECYTHGVFRRR